MTRGRLTLVALLGAGLALTASRLATSQTGVDPAPGPRPILHEYVPPRPERARGRWAREGRLPDRIDLDDSTTLPRPAAPRRAGRSERVLGADRETNVQPDRSTTHDGVLNYTAEFNPSVVPFKRMAAYDAVTASYRLVVRDPRLRPEPLARRPTPPSHTAFWGSLVLRVKRARPVPIPSVAATAEIVSYSATPPAVIQLYRDSADNLAVSADFDGQLRLLFLTDAPRRYFAAEIPPLVTAEHVPPAMRPTLPTNVAEAAGRVLSHVGVRRGQTLRRQLDRLVPYFRNFQAVALDGDSGNTYLDIALSQRGVCRHRAWAFVITLHALGVPARYVHNEAHAFTEVYLPRLGWIRVDLGGASSELRVRNAQDKAVHQPGPDPFPRPSRFSRTSYSQLPAAGVRGLAGRPRVRPAPARTDLGRLRRAARGAGQGQAGAGGTSGAGGASGSAGAGEPPPTAPMAPAGEDGQPRQAPTRVSVSCNDTAAQRGDRIRVWGRVRGGGRAAAGLRIEIYLSRNGQLAEAMIGATVSDEKGRFDVKLAVPTHLVVGDYKVYAATPGDASFSPSLSE